MPPDDPQELFDVCDENDNVIGQATRGEVHQRGLLHRAVHIFVFNSHGQLLLHKRSAGKDEYPLQYTSSASGHLSAGEDHATAAVRELKEELGLDSPVEFLTSFRGASETANEHTYLYHTQTDAPLSPDPFEIESTEYLDLREVAARIDANPHNFTPPFRLLFSWYLKHDRADGP